MLAPTFSGQAETCFAAPDQLETKFPLTRKRVPGSASRCTNPGHGIKDSRSRSQTQPLRAFARLARGSPPAPEQFCGGRTVRFTLGRRPDGTRLAPAFWHGSRRSQTAATHPLSRTTPGCAQKASRREGDRCDQRHPRPEPGLSARGRRAGRVPCRRGRCGRNNLRRSRRDRGDRPARQARCIGRANRNQASARRPGRSEVRIHIRRRHPRRVRPPNQCRYRVARFSPVYADPNQEPPPTAESRLFAAQIGRPLRPVHKVDCPHPPPRQRAQSAAQEVG